MIYYLPSCKYKAAHRDSSQKIQRYLAGKPDLEIVGCCRVSQHLGSDIDQLHFLRGNH